MRTRQLGVVLAQGLAFCLMTGSAEVRAQDVVAYGRECAARVARIPPFDCRTGVVIPITVDGRTPSTYTPDMTCDRPAMLPYTEPGAEGQCMPYSRALVLQDDRKAQVVAYCREKRLRPADTSLYDEVDIISHSVETGSTCWFQAKAREPLTTDRGLDGRRVPPPEEEKAPPGNVSSRDFWQPPAVTAKADCVSCHDSGPYMWSPWAAQTGQIPSDPWGKYANDLGAAFRVWPKPFGITTRGNTCTGCHRMGNMESCKHAMWQAVGRDPIPGTDARAQKYPLSHWMPPANWLTERAWDVTYEESVKQLGACCENPLATGCEMVPITGGQR